MCPYIIMTIDLWIAVSNVASLISGYNEFLIIGHAYRLDSGIVDIMSFSVKFLSIPLNYISVRRASEDIFASFDPLHSE